MDPSSYSPADKEYTFKQLTPTFTGPAVAPAVAAKLKEIAYRAPWLSPETSLVLAKNNASTEGIDLVGQFASRRDLDTYDQRVNVGGLSAPVRWVYNKFGSIGRLTSLAYQKTVPNTAKNTVGKVIPLIGDMLAVGTQQFKPISRYGLAALDIIPETINNVAAMGLGYGSQDIGGLWSSTSLANLLENPEDQGEGYFIGETMRLEQARRARILRGTVNGSAFTIGRGTAQALQLEGTSAYNYASGIIDAIVNIAAPDPTKWVVGGVKGVTGGLRALQVGETFTTGYKVGGGMRGIVPLLSHEDAKLLRAELRGQSNALATEAGLVQHITGKSVKAEKFVNFMKKNPTAKRLVTALRETTSASEVQDDIFQFRISNDTALRLVDAKTDDEVISALTYNWTYGENALNANIGKYQVNRYPGADSIRKSRFFSKVAKSRIVTAGTEAENTEAVQNLVLSMRSSAVPEERIKSFLNGEPGKIGAIQAFSARKGSQVDKAVSLQVYRNYLTETLRSNGIKDPIIKDILNGGSDHLERMRAYFTNLVGQQTDNGHMLMMIEHYRNKLDPDLFNAMFEANGHHYTDLTFAQPMQIVDMLNRVQVLPDSRELRRVTRNKLFSKLLAGDDGKQVIGKIPFTSKRTPTKYTEIIDQAQWDEIQNELLPLQELTGASAAHVYDRIEELTLAQKDLEREVTKAVITGKQRNTLAFVEYVQNKVWKPLNLATFGYIMRNGMDAQARMVTSGIWQPTHAIDYWYLLMGRKYGRDIKGVDITGLGVKGRTAILVEEDEIKGVAGYVAKANMDEEGLVQQTLNDVREGLVDNANRVGFTRQDGFVHSVQTSSFVPVDRTMGRFEHPQEWHTDGMVQQGQKVIADPLQRIAAVGLSEGIDDEKILDQMFAYLERNDRSPTYMKLEAQFREGHTYFTTNGELVRNPSIGLKSLRKADPVEYERLLREHFRTIQLGNVKNHIGGNDKIAFMYAHDRVPLGDAVHLPAESFDLPKNVKELKVGQYQVATVNGKEVQGVIQKIDTLSDGKQVALFQPTEEGKALTRSIKNGKNGSKSARSIIENSPLHDPTTGKGIPNKVVREQLFWQKNLPKTDVMNNKAIDWLFGSLNDSTTRRLEKSPTFRVHYYQEVGNHIDQLSAEEGLKMYNEILSKAEEEGKTIREYLGEGALRRNTIASKIENLPLRKNITGTLTYDELDEYARFTGINRTKDLLYDATATSNGTDALRIISPFAGAWADVAGHWLTEGFVDNVHLYRQATRIYKGLNEGDPDQDGRGFFYNDPQSNELMFTFPLSGLISKVFTGVNAPLSAPIKRLSQGINFYPALGPWAQFAATQLIPDTPAYNDFTKLLTPYGKKNILETANPLPGYFLKAVQAIQADPNKLGQTYANTYIETLRALSVNPKYDMNTVDGVGQLQADAKSRARILTMMRAISQFMGPTSGKTEFKVPTLQGEEYVSELIKQLRDFQETDYDSAIPKFLDYFGDDLMLYVASKSKATQAGLETSVEFDNWTRENKDIVEKFPGVGNYFAPQGSDFEFEVWARQSENGRRVPLTDLELIESAQFKIGAVKYRAARKQFGAYPTSVQLEKLGVYREYLHEQLPGFPPNAEFQVNKYENDLAKLGELIKLPELADNAITPLVRAYLQARNNAITQAGGKSLKAKKATDLRAKLYRLGETMSMREPEFARIWTRLLAQEVED